MKKEKNTAIGCSVDTCKYHCGEGECCSLKSIDVGCCNCTPHTSDGTCCQSFETKTAF